MPTFRMRNLHNYYIFHTCTHAHTLNNCHLMDAKKSKSRKQTNISKRSLGLHNFKFGIQMDFSSSFPGVNQCVCMCMCLRVCRRVYFGKIL